MKKKDEALKRCPWCGDDPLYVRYHDTEWGREVTSDRKMFELLILEGAQAGLSWYTILKRRDNYRKAFAGFDPAKVAAFTESNIERLIQDAGIIRNRAKIASAVSNARLFLEIGKEFGSFSIAHMTIGTSYPLLKIFGIWTHSQHLIIIICFQY